jgi:hypothetical protein
MRPFAFSDKRVRQLSYTRATFAYALRVAPVQARDLARANFEENSAAKRSDEARARAECSLSIDPCVLKTF